MTPAHPIRPRDESPSLSVRPIEPRDAPWIRGELTRHWHSTRICSLGVWHAADRLPGLVAIARGADAPLGLLTHTPMRPGEACEVITLSSGPENHGVGTMLLDAFTAAARSARCSRAFLTTTNDNLRALGFYQRRGWSLVAIHRGAMDRARIEEPSIPDMGMNGIPLRDEIELEHPLTMRARQ